MKKIVLILFSFISIGIYGQSACSFTSCAPFQNSDLRQVYGAIANQSSSTGTTGVLTNSLLAIIKQKQDTVNQNLRALQNRIDTSTKVFNVTYTLTSVSNYSANRTIIGNRASSQFTINLGSQYWKLTSVFVTDIGSNYGANPRIWVFSDTINISDNSLIGGGIQRVNRLISYYGNTTTINVPFMSPNVANYYPLYQTSTLQTYPIATGVISIIPTTYATVWAGINQTINIRCLFEKVKY